MCYSRSKRHRWRGSFRDNRFVIIFNLNSASCTSTCLFIGTIVNEVALFSAFKALTGFSVFLVFFVVCGFADNSGCIHRVIILRGETWSRWCAISWSVPVLVIGSRVVASRAMPDPSRSLSLSLSLSMVIKSSIFRMK